MTEPAPPPPPPPDASAGPGRARLLVIVGLLVAIAVAAGAVFLTRDGDGDTETAASTTVPSPSSTGTAESSSTTSLPTAADLKPVIVADGYVMGWWDGSTWRSATTEEGGELPPRPIDTGAPYEFVDADGASVRSVLGPVGEGCYLGTSWGVFDETTQGRIGLPLGFDILPRPVTPIAAAPAHEAAVRTWLDGEGAEDSPVSIDRVVRVDLDDDGAFEVFIEASHDADGGFKEEPGAYSVLLYRYVDADDEAQTVLVAGDTVSQGDIDSEFALAFTHRLLGLADLNGDGRMEIATASGFYEGIGISIATVRGPTITTVLETGCGA